MRAADAQRLRSGPSERHTSVKQLAHSPQRPVSGLKQLCWIVVALPSFHRHVIVPRLPRKQTASMVPWLGIQRGNRVCPPHFEHAATSTVLALKCFSYADVAMRRVCRKLGEALRAGLLSSGVGSV